MGPGLLILADRPAQILKSQTLAVRATGVTRFGDQVLFVGEDGALYSSDLELNLSPRPNVVPSALSLALEPDGLSAIAYSYAHTDARRIYADGRVELAPPQFREAFHTLVLGPNGQAAGVRSLLPLKEKDAAVSLYDGATWRRVALPGDTEKAEQILFEDAELVVVTKKTVLFLGPGREWQPANYVPAPLVQNFVNLARLGRGYLLSGQAGLLRRFSRNTHCVLDSANHETIGPLVEVSPRTVVSGWKFTVTQEPNLMWIDDALPDAD